MKLDSNQVVFVLRVEQKQLGLRGGLEPPKIATEAYTLDASLELQQNNWHFHLHDLRSGTKFSFASWQELQNYIKEQTKKGLH